MEEKMIRDIKLLKWYAGISTLAIVFLIAQFFLSTSTNRFEEINAERINIVESDGTLKMVISNKERQHPGLSNFKPLPARERAAGIIFFNSSGDECGGLTYEGNEKEAGFGFSTDQFRNDQIMQFQYDQIGIGDSVKRSYGLKLWD